MGILERGGKVRTTVVNDRKKKTLQAEVRKHVEAGSALYTDFLLSYDGLEGQYAHKVIDHAVAYVDGAVHTNTIENFWALLKRGISGTYVSVEPFHLFRYLDEQAFRYNNRNEMDDFDRFKLAVSQIVGKRLTWNEATGKNHEPQTYPNREGSEETEAREAKDLTNENYLRHNCDHRDLSHVGFRHGCGTHRMVRITTRGR